MTAFLIQEAAYQVGVSLNYFLHLDCFPYYQHEKTIIILNAVWI